jgi:hypothetical protein
MNLSFQDTRISQTPYHSLTSQERAIHSSRKELLTYLATRFREEVSKYDDFFRLPTPTLGFIKDLFKIYLLIFLFISRYSYTNSNSNKFLITNSIIHKVVKKIDHYV